MHVTNFGVGGPDSDPVAIHWSLRAAFPLTAMITLLSQGFFAHRVYVLSSVWWYPAIAIPALVVRLGLGITRGAVSTSDILTLTSFIKKFKWLIISASTLGAVIDVCNTLALCIVMGKNYNPMLSSYTDLCYKKLDSSQGIEFCNLLPNYPINGESLYSIYSVVEVALKVIWMVFFFQAAKSPEVNSGLSQPVNH
ncbi:hypothetical protein D9758_010382 [Tetrapyrgos nigripes]|uniref:Uncharacterized protein n=1 Tax=Tetrapyrgos nigripes TaxID=182062 RepID=A0A8H5CZA3_9AGAR|nr:hypothetical protein D9758_010382 [Tetrapyrgos nigripes]